MDPRDDPGISIRELADLAGTTARTIHYYTSEGLLPPPRGAKRGATYTSAHLARLRLIAALRDEGLSLAAIRTRLSPLDDPQVLAVIEELNARSGDDRDDGPSLTPLAAIETALALQSRADLSLEELRDAAEAGEGSDSMRHAPPSPVPPDTTASGMGRPLRRSSAEFATPGSSQSSSASPGSAKDYLESIQRHRDPTDGVHFPGVNRTPPPQLVRPSRPVVPPTPGIRVDAPEAWYHITIGDGIELRVREDRYRAAGGRLRAVADAAASALRRYGLSPPDTADQDDQS